MAKAKAAEATEVTETVEETVETADEAVETVDKSVEATAETTAPESTSEVKEEIQQTIYIGPSIRGVMTGTVFTGSDLPEHLVAAIEQQPVLKELIVPVSQLIEARKQLQDSNSAMSKYFRKVKGE